MGLVQSRLDFFLISGPLAFQTIDCHIKPGFKSDHSLVKLSIHLLSTQKRGKGYWKFNNKLLTDQVYIRMIKEEISKIKLTENLNNKATFWDYVKCQLRTITISYTISKRKRDRERQLLLQQNLERLENQLPKDTTLLREYHQAKREWEAYESLKTEGILTRSKIQWVEQGEKNTKYFLNLEKRNYNQKYIKKLIVNDSEIVTDPNKILEEEKQYYQKLYCTKKYSTENYSEFLQNNHLPKLTELEQQICERPLSMEEISKSLKQLANDKTPGSDGFTTNFYKFFWIDIKELVFDSFKYSFKNELLSDDQRRGILNLIPKPNKDARYLKNWRPVSLLNTDYKILTKALAMPLQAVLPKLIKNDQIGYMKDRNIEQNIRIIEDIMTYTDLKHLPGFIVLVDFEKAFDSVEWSFLLRTLETFNFGNNFIKWITILYTRIVSSTTNNGYFSKYFELSRGIRQGCPISVLLFLLVAEVMANKIRTDQKVKGIMAEKNVTKYAS